MRVDENVVASSQKYGKIGMVVGIITMFLSVLWIIFPFPMFGLGIIGSIVGYCIYVWGAKIVKMEPVLRQYEQAIVGLESISFSELADSIYEDEEKVLENLQWMWENRYFENVQLDYKNKCLKRRVTEQECQKEEERIIAEKLRQQTERERQEYREEQQIFVSETCDCCGGITMIRAGGGGKCSYCSAPIGKYKKYDKKDEAW